MGSPSAYDSRPVTPIKVPVTKEWEIETKINLLNFHLPKVSYVSEHVFYYDANDNYICSTTDDRKFKKKTDPNILNVGPVQVHIRMEELSEIPKSIPKEAKYFRVATRSRYGYTSGDCFVAFDKLVSTSGQILHQMEVEFSPTVKTFADGMLAIQSCADITHEQIALLDSTVKIDFKSSSKYEWLKTVEPPLSFTRTVGAWIQQFSRGFLH